MLNSRLSAARTVPRERPENSSARGDAVLADAPIIADPGEIDDHNLCAGGQRRRTGRPAMRETLADELGLMPARRARLVALQRDRRTVDPQGADAKAERAGIAALRDRVRRDERARA